MIRTAYNDTSVQSQPLEAEGTVMRAAARGPGRG